MKDNLNYCPIPDQNQQTVYEANVGQGEKTVVVFKDGVFTLNGKPVQPGSPEEAAVALTIGQALDQQRKAGR